jgi:amidase
LLLGGATIIGKTVCDEFFFSVTGANAHYGTPVNPRAPGRLTGGSSSGSAAATAAGACDFALGSDTGGSVRVPAAFCGVYGIRPTHGRIDITGVMPMAPSFDVPGWFASGPGVLRRVGEVLLEGAGVRAKPNQLIVLDDAFAEADAEVASLLRAAIDAMASDLPEPSHKAVAPGGFDAWRESFRIIQAREIWSIYGPFVERHRPKLGPGIRGSRGQYRSATPTRPGKNRSGARAHLRIGRAWHRSCAANGAVHCPAHRHQRRSAGIVSRSRHAADLSCRIERTAAGHLAGGFGLRLPGRPLLHRLARRR